MDINNLERFLEKTGRGEMAYGCCITFADCAVTEVACAAGMDFVWIDGEHGEMDRLGVMHHLMAVKGTGVASFYRVPSCDHTEIKKIAVDALMKPKRAGGFKRGWVLRLSERVNGDGTTTKLGLLERAGFSIVIK